MIILDLFEYISDALAQAVYPSDDAANLQSYSENTIKTEGDYSLKGIAAETDSLNKTLTHIINPISNADIDDEDMADISDWSDLDSGTGESTQVTFDSKSCMKLDSGGSAGGTNYAFRQQDIGSFGNRTVFSLKLYCDAIGANANNDFFQFNAHNGATVLAVRICSDGMFICDGVIWAEVGTDLIIQDTWQEWTFDVDWIAQTVDVYLNGILKAAGVDCSLADVSANGTIRFYQFGTTIANRISYVDWFKAGSTYICGSSIDLSNRNTLKFDLRSNRTGSNIKIGLRQTPDSYTKLLLHGEGIDGSTNIIDEIGKTVTPVGTAQLDTAQSKFGGSSLLFDGNSDYLTVPDSDDWYFGTGDFTIDLWAMFHTTDAGYFCSQDNLDNNNRMYFYKYADGGATSNKILFYCITGGVARANYVMTNTWSPILDTWYHIAFVRNGAGALLFINGQSQVLTETTAFDDLGDIAADFKIGTYRGSGDFNGWIDEFRISKGTARWISNFDVPTSPYNLIETVPDIDEVDTFQEIEHDISEIVNENKDSIDKIIITIVNADAENIFYLDNFYAVTVTTEQEQINSDIHFQKQNIQENIESNIHFKKENIQEQINSDIHFKKENIQEFIESDIHFKKILIPEQINSDIHFKKENIQNAILSNIEFREIPIYDEYTKLLLHFNGIDESTTFKDEIGKTVTPVGTAQLDTAQKKFGTASGLLDGDSDYLTVPDSDDWYFGTGDFTIDTWVRFNALPTAGNRCCICSQFAYINTYWDFSIYNDSGTYQLVFGHILSGSVTINLIKTLDPQPELNTWYHLAIVRHGNNWHFFQDGQQIGTTGTDDSSVTDFSEVLQIGKLNTNFFNGWIDEFRISKGIARWTSNFTPPTNEYGEIRSSTINSDVRFKEINKQENILSDIHFDTEHTQEQINSDIHFKKQNIQENINSDISFAGVINVTINTNLITKLLQNEIIQTVLHIGSRIFNKINTDLRIIIRSINKINTDLRIKAVADYDYQFPGKLTDIIVKLDGTELTEVNYSTLKIQYNLNSTPSNATFVLARHHDKLDYKLDGSYSQITNQNEITIYDGSKLLFTGDITKIEAISETDTVSIIAEDNRSQMEEEELNDLISDALNVSSNLFIDENGNINYQEIERGTIKSLALSSLNEKRKLYDVVIDNISVNKVTNNYYGGIIAQLGKHHAELWTYKALHKVYNVTYNPISDSYDTEGLEKQIAEDINEMTKNPEQKEGQLFVIQNHRLLGNVYVGSIPVIHKDFFSEFDLPLYTNIWIYYIYQWKVLDTISDIDTYTTGTSPLREIDLSQYGKNTNNGMLTIEGDFLGWLIGEQQDNTEFAKDLARFEAAQSNKLLTEATITLLLDAFEYYNISFKDLINITNTIEPNIYKDNNGFPLNISSINIDCSTRLVTLQLTNYGKSYYVRGGDKLIQTIPSRFIAGWRVYES